MVEHEKASSSTADKRFAKVVAAFAAADDTAAIAREYAARRARGGDKFGDRGLKVGGKIFAMVTREQLVVKLPRARVDELIAAGQGEPFTSGGRVMKEWLVVTGARLSWLKLAREACAFVSG
jgi:hypothetical protein